MKTNRKIKVATRLILLAVIAIAGVIYVCNAKIVSASDGRCFECVDSLPECETGVLLGTSIRGRYTDVNPYFRPRINGILDLYRAGKIKRIYITGDSASVDYNEPRWMADTLISEGVPAEAISLDFDGSHTLESARHAAEFTGRQPYIVVSQRFHNERFIYMARQQGAEVWGLNCGNFMHGNILQLRQRCREALSRVKAVMFD
jgi:SanA protein